MNVNESKSIGGLFYQCCDELQDVQFPEALQLIIDTLKNVLSEKLILSKEIIDSIIDCFIEELPCYIKEKLSLFSCKSLVSEYLEQENVIKINKLRRNDADIFRRVETKRYYDTLKYFDIR